MSELPGILAEIAEVAGTEAAYAIVSHCGGTRVDFPAEARPDHWLSRLLGHETASLLCKHFAVSSPEGTIAGLHHVVIPLGPMSAQKVARRRLAEELASGKSVRAAARAVGVHERTSFRVKSKLKNEDQGELF